MMAERIRRLPDWTARLAATIRAREDAPFAWGTFDCCLAAADAMLAMTGVDAAQGARGYKTARGALGALRRIAGRDVGIGELIERMAEIRAARLGLAEHPRIVQAGRGDVGLIEVEGDVSGLRHAIAFVDMTGRFWLHPAVDAPGWARTPLRQASRAWKVG
jgi:hypothetical protein